MKAEIEIGKFKSELKAIVRNTIKEEMMKVRSELLPYISDLEQEEINKLYKKPLRKSVKSRHLKI